MMWRLRTVVLVCLGGCGGGGNGPGVDSLPIDEELSLPGLSAPVDAVQDNRGMWHIYAENISDAFRAEGFLMARDRMGQLEFVRRFATGKLAALAGSIQGDLIESDIDARFRGHARNAERIFESLGEEERELLEAFAAGINMYIDQLRNEEAFLPVAAAGTIPIELMEDWSPIDTLAIARFEAAHLSYNPGEDVFRSESLARWNNVFASDANDPRYAALSESYHDLFPFYPAAPVFVRDGFPNLEVDDATRALVSPGPEDLRADQVVSLDVLTKTRRFLERMAERADRVLGDRSRGSNNWVVHGSRTESGFPILANDPHLALTSPPLFWYCHLNTKRGEGDLDVEGLALVGTPVVLLGYNRDVAWGLTTHFFDVTDVYRETIVPGEDGAPDSVEFNGELVPIETITEVIDIDVGGPREVQFEVVPHHGVIVPESRTATEALSIRWTGDEPSNEAAAILDLMRARSVDDARDALEAFAVGGQNFAIVTRDGDIFWSTQIKLPVRGAATLTYDPETREGIAPAFVLPGDGEHEWSGYLSDRTLPHDLNPEKGFIATANGDAVGTNEDGNPFNDAHYLGYAFSVGYRIARITERLEELTARGDITPADMFALQADAESPLGRRFTGAIVEQLDRLKEELSSSGTHEDLEEIAADIDEDEARRLMDARDRLQAWESFDTPAAVEDDPTQEQIADSVAASIFNATVSRLHHLAFDDELEQLEIYDLGFWFEPTMVALQFALTDPEHLKSYDDTIGDTVLWDDLATDDRVESRGACVVTAVSQALVFLADELGDDMNEWRWGRLHTLRLETIVPQFGQDQLSIPTPSDPEFPDGFPRHGDWETVDPGNFNVRSRTDFSYDAGPQQRLVVEMTHSGPVALNALPGGESLDPQSPHHADEIELWRHNEAAPIHFKEKDIVENAETRKHFVQ